MAIIQGESIYFVVCVHEMSAAMELIDIDMELVDTNIQIDDSLVFKGDMMSQEISGEFECANNRPNKLMQTPQINFEPDAGKSQVDECYKEPVVDDSMLIRNSGFANMGNIIEYKNDGEDQYTPLNENGEVKFATLEQMLKVNVKTFFKENPNKNAHLTMTNIGDVNQSTNDVMKCAETLSPSYINEITGASKLASNTAFMPLASIDNISKLDREVTQSDAGVSLSSYDSESTGKPTDFSNCIKQQSSARPVVNKNTTQNSSSSASNQNLVQYNPVRRCGTRRKIVTRNDMANIRSQRLSVLQYEDEVRRNNSLQNQVADEYEDELEVPDDHQTNGTNDTVVAETTKNASTVNNATSVGSAVDKSGKSQFVLNTLLLKSPPLRKRRVQRVSTKRKTSSDETVEPIKKEKIDAQHEYTVQDLDCKDPQIEMSMRMDMIGGRKQTIKIPIIPKLEITDEQLSEANERAITQISCTTLDQSEVNLKTKLYKQRAAEDVKRLMFLASCNYKAATFDNHSDEERALRADDIKIRTKWVPQNADDVPWHRIPRKLKQAMHENNESDSEDDAKYAQCKTYKDTWKVRMKYKKEMIDKEGIHPKTLSDYAAAATNSMPLSAEEVYYFNNNNSEIPERRKRKIKARFISINKSDVNRRNISLPPIDVINNICYETRNDILRARGRSELFKSFNHINMVAFETVLELIEHFCGEQADFLMAASFREECNLKYDMIDTDPLINSGCMKLTISRGMFKCLQHIHEVIVACIFEANLSTHYLNGIDEPYTKRNLTLVDNNILKRQDLTKHVNYVKNLLHYQSISEITRRRSYLFSRTMYSALWYRAAMSYNEIMERKPILKEIDDAYRKVRPRPFKLVLTNIMSRVANLPTTYFDLVCMIFNFHSLDIGWFIPATKNKFRLHNEVKRNIVVAITPDGLKIPPADVDLFSYKR